MAYDLAHTPSNADATPLYNDNILKVWNWFNTVWDCNDWMVWHKANVLKYGKDHANEVFLHYWNDLATGSSALDCRSFNSSFRSYMSSVGLLDSLYSGVGIVAKPIGAATDVITDVSKGVTNTAKVFKALPIILLAVLLVIGYIYFVKGRKK